MKEITVLIADDHPVVAAGIAGMLDSAPDIRVIGTAGNGVEALSEVRLRSPDIVLMDLRMPQMTGFEAIVAIRDAGLSTKVLVLTTYDTDADIASALDAGASGYLLKDATAEALFRAIREVSSGGQVLCAKVRDRLASGPRATHGTLSPREVEVLEHVANGDGNRLIAKSLFISEATVKTHLLHLFAKLGVNDRTAAVTEAMRLGILSLPR